MFKEIKEIFSEERMERLRDGEEIEILVEKSDPNPFIDDDRPRSMETIRFSLQTQGVTDDRTLKEAYPDVIGL